MNLFLIGYRGTGKTTVGGILAERLGYECVDSDAEIQRRVGRTIAEIFAADGEPAFRDLESEVVAELAKRAGTVIALGGGAVLREQNRRAIREAGRIVWLKADAETIAARIESDTATKENRPNLTAAGGRAEIEQLLTQRTPIYQSLADCEIDTQGKSPTQIADEIFAKLCPSRPQES